MAQPTLLEGRKHAVARLGDVLVLGLGKSGRAAAEYCLSLPGDRVSSVSVAAGAYDPQMDSVAEALRARGARVEFDTEDIDETFDICIASPGISQFSTFYTNAQHAAAEVVSEVEFAWRESAADAKWVAITGTNGKTTTTALAAHILSSAGLRAEAVGNIGDTCLEAVARDGAQVYVLEVSSYQLASTVYFAPDVAVLLNITPDHLSWHGSFEEYVKAKKRIFAHMSAGSVAVVDATDDQARALCRAWRTQTLEQRGFSYIPVGTADGIHGDMRSRCGSENAAFVQDDGTLVVAFNGTQHTVGTVDGLQLPGEHNVDNALCAASAAVALGVDAAAIAEASASFASLEHRIEPCGSIDGIACYNDSKATNVDATLKALAAFDPRKPIVLLGGCDKGTNLDTLVQQAQRHCKAVVCFGAAGPRFSQAFEGSTLPVYDAQSMESALDEALHHAQAGDIVVLSPACSSFDEFSCFEERGDVFKQLVANRASG